MQVAFDNAQLYAQVFSRNNKKQAHKNIRCFPLCSERGHVEQGFCGQPIVIRVSRPAGDRQELFAWGELKRCDTSRMEDEPPPVLPIDVGTVVTLEQLLENSKDPKTAKTETLDKPLFEGRLEKHQNRNQQELKFAFNEQKKGWSYNWQATKHTAKARHAFFVYLFVQNNADAAKEFTCVGVHMSPSFILYCRKTRAVGSRRTKPPAVTAAAAATAAEESCRKRSKCEEDCMPQWFDPPLPPPVPAPIELQLDDIDFALLNDWPPTVPTDNNVEEEDMCLLDLETAIQVDAASIKRIELVLQAIYTQLTKEGTADLFDLNQFSLDWFVKDLGTVREEVMWSNSGGSTPRSHPAVLQDASPLVVQLANYLLEESTLTASVRQIVQSSLDRIARREALLRMFNHELATFLVTFGYTERDLDQALLDQQHSSIGSPSMSDSTVHFSALEEQLAQMASSTQQRAFPPTCRATVSPQADLSGHWRLDDSVLNAFDECRSKRGVPYMLRKLISYTESKVVLHHTVDSITLEHKSKLFSIGQEIILLDSRERALRSALPMPWSNHTLRGEFCFAEMENDMVVCTRTYGGKVRTVVTARKDESDRLEIDIQYLEKRPGIDLSWKCIFAKRGYGLRIASID